MEKKFTIRATLRLLQSLGSHGGGKGTTQLLSLCLPSNLRTSLSNCRKQKYLGRNSAASTKVLDISPKVENFFLVYLPKGADRMQVAWNVD